MKIVVLSSEVADIIKSGGLADVAKALPLQLTANGHDVRVIMPCHTVIKNYQQLEVIGQFILNEDFQDPNLRLPYTVRRTYLNGTTEVWLIENDQYFNRTSMYGDNNQGYADNGARYAFFCAAALDASKKLGFNIDILHCNDWHTGLGPMIMRIKYASDPAFNKARSVVTIHNGAFQGAFDRGQVYMIPEIANVYNDKIMQGSYINFLKCAVYYADKISTVSPGYCDELKSYLGGHGMTPNYLDRQADMVGILNGCDYSDWDPSSDKLLRIRYDLNTLDQKILGKYVLQRRFGFEMGDTPMYGMVARLTDQKGVGLIIPILERFLSHKVQVVIQGTGDPFLAQQLSEIEERHHDKFRFISCYDNTIAHQIEAASDFFLMPSIFEPCGLTQLISLRYGTLPIVRETGGLKDTVQPYNEFDGTGTGFSFANFNGDEMLGVINYSKHIYYNHRDQWDKMVKRSMEADFSWNSSARQYEGMYSWMINW